VASERRVLSDKAPRSADDEPFDVPSLATGPLPLVTAAPPRYDVAEDKSVVTVQVVGEKHGNRLIVQGQEYVEHESH
jgi:hypothetical protein